MFGTLTGPYKLFILICLVRVVDSARETKIKDIKALADKLMVNYSKHIIPSENRVDPFNITIYVGLEAIGDIDEIEERLSTVIRLIYEWTDDSIKWSLEDTNVSYITLGWTDVWKPVVRVTNPQTDSSNTQYYDRSYETVFFENDGWAYFDEMVTTITTCNMDMSYFPFDTQTCEIKLAVIEASKFWFDLNVSIYEGFHLGDTKDGSWNIVSMTATSHHGNFVIELTFERRPLFLLVNIILPLFILALLTPVVFVLPKKSGERAGYAVTMLLAISVYMTIVSENLPNNSKPAPLLPVMIFVLYVYDAVVVLIVILNTKFDLTNDTKPVPKAFCKFAMLTRKLVCQNGTKHLEKRLSGVEQDYIEMESIPKDEQGTEMDEGIHNESFEVTAFRNKVTWQEFSQAIDKWCFVISYMVKVAVPVVFFTVMKCNSKT